MDAVRRRRVAQSIRQAGGLRGPARGGAATHRTSRAALLALYFLAEVDKTQETILLSASGSSKHGPRYRAITNPGIAALVERAILWGHNDQIFRAALAAAGAILAQRKG